MISPSWSPQTSHDWPNVVSNLCKALHETLPFLNERSNVLLPIPKLFEELTLTPTACASAFVAVGPFVPSEGYSAVFGLSEESSTFIRRSSWMLPCELGFSDWIVRTVGKSSTPSSCTCFVKHTSAITSAQFRQEHTVGTRFHIFVFLKCFDWLQRSKNAHVLFINVLENNWCIIIQPR